MTPEEAIREALFRIIRRLSAEAAYESLYGEEIPESAFAEMLERPVAFDPRFDLDPDTPLVIDDVSRALGEVDVHIDLRARVAARGLDRRLVDAETVADYLAVLYLAAGGDFSRPVS